MATPARADTAEPELLREDLAMLAALSAGAALIHLSLVGEHLRENLSLGIAFLLCGVFQAVAAIEAFRTGRRWMLQAGILVNLAAVLAWLASRTVGLPLVGGVEHEAAGLIDVVCVVDELLVVALAWAACGAPLTERSPLVRGLLWTGAAPAALVTLSLVSMGASHAH